MNFKTPHEIRLGISPMLLLMVNNPKNLHTTRTIGYDCEKCL